MATLTISGPFKADETGKDSRIRRLKQGVEEEVKKHNGKLKSFRLENAVLSITIEGEPASEALQKKLAPWKAAKVAASSSMLDSFIEGDNESSAVKA